MKRNLSLIFCLGFLWAYAGNTTIIYLDDYSASTEVPKFKMISIEVGDTVRWVSSKTSFLLDGRYDIYPNNPTQIYSSDTFVHSFEYVFKRTGDYGYECLNSKNELFYLGVISVTEDLLTYDIGEYAMELRTNPFDKSLELSCHYKVKEIEVFNESGELVTARLFENGTTDRKIDLSHIHSGPHLIRMITDSGVYIKRVIKK